MTPLDMPALSDVTTTPETDIAQAVSDALSPHWHVVLHNDNSIHIDVPIAALKDVVGLAHHRALQLSVSVHRLGKDVVATTTLERAELFQVQLTEYRLTVTLEKAHE
jgi:ATP-dependent Clp protease adapter protein ClpS